MAVAAPRDINSLAWLQDDALSAVKLNMIGIDGQAEKRIARAIVTD